jgi:hypothetical protein
MHHDPHAVLGVPRSVSRAALKRAFRARAQATHPDHGGSRAEFEAIVTAYETLLATAPSDAAVRLARYSATAPTPSRFCAYDGTRRPPKRDFATVLAAAIAAAA